MNILYIIFGIIGGILAGMGMGGGTLLIPLLTFGLCVSQKGAQFVNLIAFLPMSVLAISVHIKNGYFVKDKILFVIVPAVLFAVLGSYLASVTDMAILQKYFGYFLIILGIFSILLLFKQKNGL